MEGRDYQIAATESVFDYFSRKSGNPIIGLPTGTGKSVVIALFIREALQRYPGTRMMCLTHVKELISQNYERALQVWPTIPAGVYSSGLGRKETIFDITFAGIQSCYAKAELFGRIDILLIDECHLVSPEDETRYQKFIKDLMLVNPYLKVIGLSATAYRMKTGSLVDSGLFTDFCFDMTSKDSFLWFIDQGYLLPLVPKRTVAVQDTTGVHLIGGEFNARELEQAVNTDALNNQILDEMLATAHDRARWLIFASGAAHAEALRDGLLQRGIRAGCVHSKMKGNRDDELAAFREGEYQAMVNNNILTTGFDLNLIDCIGVARPTRSPGLWVQMLGRGTRPVYSDGFDLSTTEGRMASIRNSVKQNCLVLDFSRNTATLGPINDPVLPKRSGKKKGDQPGAPVKVCETCATYNPAGVRYCVNCGAEFPVVMRLEHRASELDLIRTKDKPVSPPLTVPVDRIIYRLHKKKDRPDSVCVEYGSGLLVYKEWVCPEHGGFASQRAYQWWTARSHEPAPNNAAEFLERRNSLATPTRITIRQTEKHVEVIGYDFDDTAGRKLPLTRTASS